MKKAELDIGSFDTPCEAGLHGEFRKMRQWLSGSGVWARVVDRIR
jgi:hypothetical protein